MQFDQNILTIEFDICRMSRYIDIDLKMKRLPPVTGYWHEKLVSLEEALKPIEPFVDRL